MDARHFDALAKVLSVPDSRRRLLGLLATLPVAGGLLGFLDLDDTDAKDRRRRRKQRHKQRKNPGNRKKGCTPQSRQKVCLGQCGPVKSRQTCGKTVDCGSCACDPPCAACFTCDAGTRTCVSACSANETCCDAACVDQQTDADHCGACGTACGDGHECRDGVCGAVCGSAFCPAATQICVDDVCTPCTVTCNGSAADCGETLQAALSGSAPTLHVCSGIYQGGFSISRDVTVIGAGDGADPASSTILDGNATQPVLLLSSGTVTLRQLRFRNGNGGADLGGGITYYASSLTMLDCTVAGNAARSGAGLLGGGNLLTMTRCTVRDNVSRETEFQAATGGGLSPGGVTTLTDCLIADNVTDGAGGGIYMFGGVLTLAGTTTIQGNEAVGGGGLFVSGSAVATVGVDCRITRNRADAGQGGGIYATASFVVLEGAATPSPIVVDNCHENCNPEVPNCQSGGSCPV